MAREAIPGARQPVDAGPDTATATRPPISDPPHASWRPQRRYFRTLLTTVPEPGADYSEDLAELWLIRPGYPAQELSDDAEPGVL